MWLSVLHSPLRRMGSINYKRPPFCFPLLSFRSRKCIYFILFYVIGVVQPQRSNQRAHSEWSLVMVWWDAQYGGWKGNAAVVIIGAARHRRTMRCMNNKHAWRCWRVLRGVWRGGLSRTSPEPSVTELPRSPSLSILLSLSFSLSFFPLALFLFPSFSSFLLHLPTLSLSLCLSVSRSPSLPPSLPHDSTAQAQSGTSRTTVATEEEKEQHCWDPRPVNTWPLGRRRRPSQGAGETGRPCDSGIGTSHKTKRWRWMVGFSRMERTKKKRKKSQGDILGCL